MRGRKWYTYDMKVYHYASVRDWKDIKKGSYRSNDQPGLGASRRVGQDDMDAWNTAAVFCFLDPIPPEWVGNEHFKLTWDAIKHDIGGRMLLEIDVDEKDQVFVIDRGLAEGFLYEDKKDIPGQYIFPTRREGESAYLKSKVPLKEYLERRKEYNYTLPEVIITGHVPLEKIKISELQPILEEDLKKYKNTPAIIEGTMRDINSIPELRVWYEKREEKKRNIPNEMTIKFR